MPSELVAFRFDRDLVRRLDQHARRLERENPGLRVSRAAAVRTLLIHGLDAAERREARHGKA